MRSQMVVIINGRGGVGKDTLIGSLNPFYAVRNISSITPIKDLAGRAGWNGEKDEKSRKLLSDLKSLLTAYNDYPLTYLMYEYNKFITSHDDIMFVQIREPEEIDKFKKQVTIPCVTLLVVRDGVNSPLGNTSDDNCDQYLYDYIFRNNYSIEQMQDQFAQFIKQIFIDAYRNPYVKTDGPEEIQIVYHNTSIAKLDYIGGKSDWIDLRAAEEVELHAGEFKAISLGISMKLPDGYEAHVVPRSSTFKNYGIIQANSMGIIDQTYCGQSDIWRFPAYATRDTVIHVNDRICQFRIVKNQPKLAFNEVSELTGENRGGFGSTGIS